jgi:hypothetical protein
MRHRINQEVKPMPATHQQPRALKAPRNSVQVTPYDVRYGTLLALIGRIGPEAWDAIVPHGPRLRVPAGEGHLDWAALNPQPLPPEDRLLTAAAQLAHELVRGAITIEMQGGSSSGPVSELIDEWCGTPWPRRWPWPWPGPRPDDGPLPDPWAVQTARVVGALIFASMASRLSDGDLQEALAKGADRLTEAALTDAR